MKKLWDIIMGTTMIFISLIFQFLFFVMVVGFGINGILNLVGINGIYGIGMLITIIFLSILFNTLSCLYYFKKRIVYIELGSEISIFFLFPRGIDKILY